MGEYVAGTVNIVADEDGRTYFVWTQKIDDESLIHFTVLDANSQSMVEKDLELPIQQLRQPKVLFGIGNQLHLFWSNREFGESDWSVWYALVSKDGEEIEKITQLSSPVKNANGYDAAEDGRGGVSVSWSLDDGEGVYYAHLSSAGLIDYKAEKLSETGDFPSLRIDNEGMVNLSWAGDQGMYYDRFPVTDANGVSGQKVVHIAPGWGNALYGPNIGLSDGWVYILWSILNQAGLESGTAQTEYVSFPSGAPVNSASQRINMDASEDLSLAAHNSPFQINEISPPGDSAYHTDYVYQPATPQGVNPTLPVSVSFIQQYRTDVFQQVAVGFFTNGEFDGYGAASKTTNFSSRSVIAVGGGGNLFAAWREGSGGNHVYFSSTASAVKDEMSKLDSGDWANLLLQGGMEALTGALLFPQFGLLVILPGLLIVGIYKYYNDFETANNKKSQIVLGITLLIFQVVKIFVIPSMKFYVPFSAWIELPENFQLLLRIIVPIAIFSTGLVIAARLNVKRGGISSMVFYLAQTIPDAFLTLAIYGVVFLGVF
ncbi:MAG: hypothetical protein N2D54_06235 [Chloroflexota bacterium]